MIDVVLSHDLVKDLKVGRFDGGKEVPYQCLVLFYV